MSVCGVMRGIAGEEDEEEEGALAAVVHNWLLCTWEEAKEKSFFSHSTTYFIQYIAQPLRNGICTLPLDAVDQPLLCPAEPAPLYYLHV